MLADIDEDASRHRQEKAPPDPKARLDTPFKKGLFWAYIGLWTLFATSLHASKRAGQHRVQLILRRFPTIIFQFLLFHTRYSES